jgi:hypothetical protein
VNVPPASTPTRTGMTVPPAPEFDNQYTCRYANKYIRKIYSNRAKEYTGF